MQRVLCALPLAALTKADLHAETRTGELKTQEYKFAKRAHLDHAKSVVCVFQCHRKQHGSSDVWCNRLGGTRPEHPLHRDFGHSMKSCRVASSSDSVATHPSNLFA